jgi:hypothetical protein
MNLDSKTKRNERKKLISPMFVSASPSSYDSSPQYTPTLLDRSEEMLSEVKTYSVMEQELFVQQRDEQVEDLEDVCLDAERSILVGETFEIGEDFVLEEILQAGLFYRRKGGGAGQEVRELPQQGGGESKGARKRTPVSLKRSHKMGWLIN